MQLVTLFKHLPVEVLFNSRCEFFNLPFELWTGPGWQLRYQLLEERIEDRIVGRRCY